MSSDIVRLFKLIQQRNHLASIRACKRARLARLMKIKANALKSKKSRPSLDEDIKFATKEYSLACKQLSILTDKNKKFRSEMKSKYSTVQKTDASNKVSYIILNIDGEKKRFDFKEMIAHVEDSEINEILLGNEVKWVN